MLPTQWRLRAVELRAWAAAEGAAQALEKAAEQLDAALQGNSDELLTLTQAAAASGYTADHLGRLVRAGTLANVGRVNAPRVRRSELPVKLRNLPQEQTPTHLLDTRRIALDVVNS
jgi:SLT domain-containing protein